MTTVDTEPRRRAPLTYERITAKSYGHVLAVLAEIGPASSVEIARALADACTPHDGVERSLGTGWYPMSVARLMTQIQKHHYPVERDPETGLWRFYRASAAQRAAIAECYRLAALDDRPRMHSRGN